MTVKEFYEYCKSNGAENATIKINVLQIGTCYSSYPIDKVLSFEHSQAIISVISPNLIDGFPDKDLQFFLDKAKKI